MKKLAAEQNLKKDRLSGIFLGILVLFVVFLAVARVVIANRLVEASEKLRILDKSITQAETTNQDLSEQLHAPESLSQIAKVAREMGFTKTSRLVFLTTTPEVALGTTPSQVLR